MEIPAGLVHTFPPEAIELLLVLFLSLLIGLERESHVPGPLRRGFGGVRTFPLIGLLGYGLGLLSTTSVLPEVLGLGAVTALMVVSLQHKYTMAEAMKTPVGATSEASGLLVYVIGALVQHGLFWISTTLTVAALLLLELKAALERLSQKLPADEVLIFAKFLALAAVILPVVPNERFGSFEINPFKTWLVVVAVTGLSYGSYLLHRVLPQAGGARLTALLGGAYSSTLVTVALARQSRGRGQPHLMAGSILMASGMMYLRIALLLSLFNRPLMETIGLPFVGLATLALLGGWLWSLRRDAGGTLEESHDVHNPLELSAAFLFAVLFVAMQVATKLTLKFLGEGGVYSLAAIMGVTDVDPFILGIAQGAGDRTPLMLAAGSIVIAAASNNLVKGLYARGFADRSTGNAALALLAALAAAGLTPLLWLR